MFTEAQRIAIQAWLNTFDQYPTYFEFSRMSQCRWCLYAYFGPVTYSICFSGPAPVAMKRRFTLGDLGLEFGVGLNG